MTIGVLYISLLVLGGVYALITGGLGWFSDVGGGGDIHVDAGGHMDAGHPHPISGTTVATFITGFGGGGVLAHYLFEWGRVPGLLFAFVSGLVLAAAAFGVLETIFSQTQAGAEFATEEVTGREAEVITTIPAGGAGEVAYEIRGQREQASARVSSGASVPKGRIVVIEKVMGQTVYVRPKE
jgi:membrane protein implicated in regulation of membrane protease activity